MKPDAVRRARGSLRWTQAQLAQRAGIGLSTLKDFKSGARTPHAQNLERLRSAFEAQGLMLVGDVFVPADDVLDAIASNPNPSTEQSALAILAAGVLRRSGGRIPKMSEAARLIVEAGKKRRGETT